MSSTPNNPYLVKSMSGNIVIQDGAGTVIENGVITTNGLKTNNILAEDITQPCSLFANSTSSGVSLGNPSGATYVRSYFTPVSGYDVINYVYLTTTYYTNLMGLTNIWTGVSNTFQNIIYAGMIQGIGANTLIVGSSLGALSLQGLGMAITASPTGDVNISAATGVVAIEGLKIDANNIQPIITNGTIKIGTATSITEIGTVEIDGNNLDCVATLGDLNIGISNAGRINMAGQSPTVFGGGVRIIMNVIDTFAGFLTLGSSSSIKTFIQNTQALIIGTDPTTYDGNGYISGFGMRFYNSSPYSMLDMFSNTGTTGTNPPSARIAVNGGTSIINQGNLTIDSGNISITASLGSVKVEGLAVSGTDIQSILAATTTNFFTTQTATLNIGGSATAVSVGGNKTQLAVNTNYSHEFNAGSNSCWHDFHSYATAVNDYDARIYCNGATAGNGTGLLQIIAANIRFSGGISFAKGNLSAASLIQTGSVSGIAQVAANSAGGTAIAVNFTTAFGTAPIVNITAWSYLGNNAAGLITTVYLTSTTQFQFNVYNARSVNSGLFGIHWHAIGGY